MIRVGPLLLVAGLFPALTALPVAAQALSLDVEAVRVSGVGGTWQSVDLVNTYTSPVVACTYNLPSSTSNDATVRVRNAASTSFEVRVQQFETSSAVTASDVHCLIAETGANTLSDGKVIEAHTVLSDNTSGLSIGWSAGTTENVTSMITGGFSSLVVLGQVMTFNDSQASVFWTNNCASRNAAPTPAAFCVGKHIGQINDTRLNETLGFIVTDPGSGTVNDVDYTFGQGSDTVAGVGNAPPYQYTVTGNFDTAVLTQAAEDGGQGGWAVLYGADPLPNNRINLAIEEERVAGDTSRTHTREPVYYGAFRNFQTANIAATKTTDLYTGSTVPYAIPGSDVTYTLTVESTGTAPIDRDTVFMFDTLGDGTVFYNDDMDDGGPETDAVAFDPMSSGLTFDPANDLAFSTMVAPPASFAACSYRPPSPTGYDDTIRHVCINPKGRLRAGSLQTDTDFTWSFRARVE